MGCKLREVVPWQRFTYRLVKHYNGKARTGRPPIDPSLVPPTGYKNRILENGKLKAYTRLLNSVVQIAMEQGVVFGSLQIQTLNCTCHRQHP